MLPAKIQAYLALQGSVIGCIEASWLGKDALSPGRFGEGRQIRIGEADLIACITPQEPTR